MQANSRCTDYFNFFCPCESGNFGKQEKKLQKIEYLENEGNFLDETEIIFQTF